MSSQLLEKRSMATGLFWSPPASIDPSMVQAYIYTFPINYYSSKNINTPSNNHLTEAYATGINTGDDGFGDYSYMTAFADAQIIDNGSSPNSGAPVGNATIQQLTSNEIDMTAPSSNPFGSTSVGLDSRCSADSSYFLADDGALSPSTNLTEHFHIVYTGPSNPNITDQSFAYGGTSSGFGWLMQAPGYATLNGTYPLTPNTTGTIYPSNGATIDYDFSVYGTVTELEFTVVTPISDLSPPLTTLPTQTGDVSTMVGFQYSASSYNAIILSGEPTLGVIDTATLTTEFDAHM